VNKIIKDAMILTAITLVAGFGLGYVHDITAGPIEKAEYEKKQATYKNVLADAKEFTDVKIDDAKLAKNQESFAEQTVTEVVQGAADGKTNGYVVTVVSKGGYGGDITMSVGISAETNMVTGVDFLSMSESPGLGDNAKKPEFNTQYVGKKADSFKVVKEPPKSDDEIKAITGATITSRCVTNGVSAALLYYNNALTGGAEK